VVAVPFQPDPPGTCLRWAVGPVTSVLTMHTTVSGQPRSR